MIYLDHAATTPVPKAVADAMYTVLTEEFGNPSAQYPMGQEMHRRVDAWRAVIAGAVKGDIDVQGPVVLDTSAIVMGNIKSKAVQINNGAVIEGMCSQCYADVNPSSFFEDYKKGKTK